MCQGMTEHVLDELLLLTLTIPVDDRERLQMILQKQDRGQMIEIQLQYLLQRLEYAREVDKYRKNINN